MNPEAQATGKNDKIKGNMVTNFSTMTVSVQPKVRLRPAAARTSTSTTAAINDRRKKWAPKVRTGCRTCRQRRVKCDETKPECRRCRTVRAKCIYSLLPAARPPSPNALVLAGGGGGGGGGAAAAAGCPLLVRQPIRAVLPAGVKPSGHELEMFAIFCNETVRHLGTFNMDFWATDVPRAAQAYPALWHASLAMAAMQERVKAGAAHLLSGTEMSEPALATSRHHYVFALDQFNKSIAHLSRRLGDGQRQPLTYADKEMVMLTNVLYVGICNSFGNITQTLSHIKNTIDLIGRWRFGEECEAGQKKRPPQGGSSMLRSNELLAVLAFIDGQSNDFDECPDRFQREYVMAIPDVESFSTMTDAYLSFLIIVYDCLKRINYADTHTPKGRIQALKAMLEDYQRRLDDYEERRLAGPGLSKEDANAIWEIRLYLRYFEIHFAQRLGATTRAAFIKGEEMLDALLDDVDTILSTRRPYNLYFGENNNNNNHHHHHQLQKLSAASRTKVHSFAFCPTPCGMIVDIARSSYTPRIRFKTQELMKKYRFKEGCRDREYTIARNEAFIQFMTGGPQRTLPMQRQGYPAKRQHPDTAVGADGRPFDGTQGCECLEGVYICLDHRLYIFELEMVDGDQYMRMRSPYDVRYGFGGELVGYRAIAEIDAY